MEKQIQELDETPMMMLEFSSENAYHNNEMLRDVLGHRDFFREHYIYAFFNMGSVKLDIDNPGNHIICNDTYTEFFNTETGEYTCLKNESITGFVLEPKPLTLEDDEESDQE